MSHLEFPKRLGLFLRLEQLPTVRRGSKRPRFHEIRVYWKEDHFMAYSDEGIIGKSSYWEGPFYEGVDPVPALFEKTASLLEHGFICRGLHWDWAGEGDSWPMTRIESPIKPNEVYRVILNFVRPRTEMNRVSLCFKREADSLEYKADWGIGLISFDGEGKEPFEFVEDMLRSGFVLASTWHSISVRDPVWPITEFPPLAEWIV